MKTHNVKQGSPDWIALRAGGHFCASEAPAMLGFCPHMTRNELLHAKKTYSAKEFSDYVQKQILDKGHDVEAATRALAEELVGEDLYPITGTVQIEGLDLLASFDGLTADDVTSWENKLWNEELVRLLKDGDLPPAKWPQVEQQLLVSGGEKALFTVSLDGTKENTVFLWYRSKPERRQQVLAGWKQFREDLEAYKPVEVIPAATAAPVKQLPAIIWKRDNNALTHNLDVYRAAAQQLVEDSKKKLETDQDFADCEAMVKAFEDGEKKIELIKAQVLGEIEDVDKFSRDLTQISELFRQARLNGTKQISARKDQIRYDIMEKAKTTFAAHIATLNERLGKPHMPAIAVDFATAMKSKRTLESLRNAVDTELARGKIAANEVADRIQINLGKLRDLASDYKALFADTAQIVLKSTDDLVALIENRITKYKDDEAARLEKERAKIRAEEETKAKAEAEAKVRAEAEVKAKQEAEEKARLEAEDMSRLEAEDKKPGGGPAAAVPAPAVPPEPNQPGPAAPAAAAPAPAIIAETAVVTASASRTRGPAFSADRLRQLITDGVADMDKDELTAAYAAIKGILDARAARRKSA